MKYDNDKIQKNEWVNHWKNIALLEKAKNIISKREYVLYRIKLYLSESEISNGKTNKIRAASKLFNYILNNFDVIKDFNNRFHREMYHNICSFYPEWQSSTYFKKELEKNIIKYKGEAYLDDIIYDIKIIY